MAARKKQRPAAMQAASKRWRARHPERYAMTIHRRVLKEYGITPEQYETMLVAQGGRCALCKRFETIVDPRKGSLGGLEPTSLPRRLAVDHDHETDKVRGLLCQKCNVGLGCFRDNPELLELAAMYVRAFA